MIRIRPNRLLIVCLAAASVVDTVAAQETTAPTTAASPATAPATRPATPSTAPSATTKPSAAADAPAQTTPPMPYGELKFEEPPEKLTFSPRTVQLLDQAIQNETDPIRRVELATDLARCPSPESRSALVRTLGDTNASVRAAAVRGIAMLGVGESQEAVAKLAGDESPVVRREVVRAGVEAAILKGLDDADAEVRLAALTISVSDATDRAISQKIPKLEPAQQAIAARSLAARNATGSSAAIAALLESESVVVRVAAIHSLATLKAIGREQIEKQLAHAHPSVRTMAATAIETLPSADERFAVATRALGDADLTVRVPAAKVLGPLGRPESLDLLLKQLGAGYEPLRLEARNALVVATQKNNDLAQPLATKAATMLGDQQADRRIDASFLLGVLGSHEGFEQHLALLNDADWRVVAQAAEAMGVIGDPAAGAPLVGVYRRAANIDKPATPAPTPKPGSPENLIEALARGKAGEQAILSCAKLGHKQIIEETKSIYGQKTGSSQFRGAALWALGVMGTPEQIQQGARPLLARLRDPEESGGVIIEAIRALGNGRVKAALPQLKQIRENKEVFQFSLAANRSIDYINGTNTPMIPDAGTVEPETSIRALTPVAK